jgi:hypothetical protein
VAQNLNSITLNLPSSDPNATEGGQFTLRATGSLQGGGGINPYSLVGQVSTTSASSGFVDITTTTGLSTDSTNPLTGLTDESPHDWTIDCDTADTYWVRVAGDPDNGTNYTILSSAQQVTVNAAAGVGSGDAVMTAVEASGTAAIFLKASGSPAIDAVEASGTANLILPSTGSPAILSPVAAGVAAWTRTKTWSVDQNIMPVGLPGLYGTFTKGGGGTTKTSNGSPAITAVEATGTAGRVLGSSGSPAIATITASGTAENVKTASGSPAIDEPTPTGTAGRILGSSGSPAIDAIEATGTAENVKTATGSPAIAEVEASGTAAQELSATGSPAIDAVEAAGTAKVALRAIGNPAIEAVTASGSAAQELSASGSPAIAEVEATGTATLGAAQASGNPAIDEIQASGTAAQTLSATGSPAITEVEASGTAEHILPSSGSPAIDEVEASGAASQELSATGTPAVDAVTASGTAGRVLGATGSPTLDSVEATGTAAKEGEKAANGSPALDEITASGTAAQTYSATGSPAIDAVEASGTATNIVGATAQRNMGPHGLVANYPDVLREFDCTVPIVGRGIECDAGESVSQVPTEAIQLGPHGLTTKDRTFQIKGVGQAEALIQGAQINLEFETPDSSDATIYPDGQDADADAGSVAEAEAQVSGAQIQAQAGTSASAVSITATIVGASIQTGTGDSTAVPGTGVTIDGAAIVAQAATPSDIHYDFAVFGMSGAQINSYAAEIGWDTNFDVGALVYGREADALAGTVTQETSVSEPQQGSMGGGGEWKKGGKRKKFRKQKFHMPLAGVALRDQPFEDPVIEEDIEQIVDEVIEAAEELESKGYAEAISADIIADMARPPQGAGRRCAGQECSQYRGGIPATGRGQAGSAYQRIGAPPQSVHPDRT